MQIGVGISLSGAAAGGAAPSLDSQAAAWFAARATPKQFWSADYAAGRFQDTAGTTPLTASGQPFGRINDRSGAGNHYGQATAAKQPPLLVSGGLSFISADGVTHGMYTLAPLDLSTVKQVTIILGGRKRNSDGTAMLMELGDNFYNVPGRFAVFSTQGAQAYYQFGASGANNVPNPIVAAPQPTDTFVIVAQADLTVTSGVSVQIERNGVVVTDSTAPGDRFFVSAVCNLLCRNQSDLFSPFDLSSGMVIGGAYPSAADLLMLKRATAEKCGAVLP